MDEQTGEVRSEYAADYEIARKRRRIPAREPQIMGRTRGDEKSPVLP